MQPQIQQEELEMGGSRLSSSAHPPPLVIEAIEHKYASLISQDVRVYLVIDVSGLTIVDANKKQLVRRVTRIADVTQVYYLFVLVCGWVVGASLPMFPLGNCSTA
jgi:hypothetical protein